MEPRGARVIQCGEVVKLLNINTLLHKECVVTHDREMGANVRMV